MRKVLGWWRSRHALRVGVISSVAIAVVACSPDTTRFSDNSLGSPYASRQPSNQMAAAPVQSAPVARIERQPLPQTAYAQPQYAPPQNAPPQYAPPPQYAQPPQYAPPAPPLPPHANEVTGSVTPARPAGGSWDWNGGTAIVIAPGDTIAGLAHKHHVPANIIMQA